MEYPPNKRRAYYLKRKEYHLAYSRNYVKEHSEKYLKYYRDYSKMKRDFMKQFEYKPVEPEPEPKVKKSNPIPIPKPKVSIKDMMPPKVPKEKGLCTICNIKFKGSHKQHIATTKHVINQQSFKSKELKTIKENIMTSDSIKYFEMFDLDDLKEALVSLGHYEVESMTKEELYAYIITLINADDVEEVSEEESSEDEVDYHGVIFKCAYSE
jgi:hypothetical protein